MATAQPGTTLTGLECSICTDTFDEPKLLECLHNFCKKCLKEYHKSDANVISCPICRGETILSPLGIDSLRTNFLIVGLIDEISMQNKLADYYTLKPKCEVCEEDSEATHHCTDCSQDICSACLKMHRRCIRTREHFTASLEDIRQGKINVKKHLNRPKCDRHDSNAKLFYCATCEELICVTCIVRHHCKPPHDVVDYQNAADQRRHRLDEMLHDFNQIRTNLKKSVENTSAIRQKLDQNISQTIKQVNKETDKMIAKIKDKQKRLIDEIKQEEETRHQTLDEHDKKARVMLERLNHSLNTAKGLIQTTSDWDFLSVFPMIDKDLKSLTSVDIPEVDDGLSYLKLLAGCGTVGDVDLGRLDLHEVLNWELGLDIGKNGCYTDVCFVDPDRIALTDCNRCRVVTYNTNGNMERTIQMKERLWRIAALHSQLVVVDDTDLVKMYTKKGRLACTFPTVDSTNGKAAVNLHSVAVRRNVVLVGDIKRKVVTEHHTDGSLIRTIAVDTPPCYMAVYTDNRLVVSGGGQHVDIVDNNGRTLFTIKPVIKDHQNPTCKGVCCHATDIYIAVHSSITNGHINRYDSRGRFISCVVNGLYNPRGIALSPTNRLMAVADNLSVKIYNKV